MVSERQVLRHSARNEQILHGLADTSGFADIAVFHGGGALHFVFGSPRYSTDLDFSINPLDASLEDIADALSTGVVVGDDTLKPSIQDYAGGRGIRLKYKIEEGQKLVKVEIVQVPTFTAVETEGAFAPIKASNPHELYADKLTATLSRMLHRRSIKPSDLYDIVHLGRNFDVTPDIEMVGAKADIYNDVEILERSNVDAVVRYICAKENTERFANVISRGILGAVAEHTTFDEAYFLEAAAPFHRLVR